MSNVSLMDTSKNPHLDLDSIFSASLCVAPVCGAVSERAFGPHAALPTCACTHLSACNAQAGTDRCNARADVARCRTRHRQTKNLFVNFLKLFFIGALFLFLTDPLWPQEISFESMQALIEWRWGVVAYNDGLPGKSLLAMERANSLNPTDPKIKEWLGWAIGSLGRNHPHFQFGMSLLKRMKLLCPLRIEPIGFVAASQEENPTHRQTMSGFQWRPSRGEGA